MSASLLYCDTSSIRAETIIHALQHYGGHIVTHDSSPHHTYSGDEHNMPCYKQLSNYDIILYYADTHDDITHMATILRYNTNLIAIGQHDDFYNNSTIPHGIKTPLSLHALLAKIITITNQKIVTLTLDNECFFTPHNHSITLRDMVINLTQKESELLLFLVTRPLSWHSKHDIYHHIWGMQHLDDTSRLETHISSLRKKIKLATNKPIITTLKGCYQADIG